MDFSSFGLIVISIAWIIQLVYSWNGNKKINYYFILLYMLGVVFLMIGIYLSTKTISYYELSTLIASGLLLIRLNLSGKR